MFRFRVAVAVLLLLTSAGAVLRWHTIGTRSLWMDEARQVSCCLKPDILRCLYCAAAQQQPPLDYAVGFALMRLFSFSESVVRAPAMVFGTLLIPAVFLLGLELFAAPVALSAALLIACSPQLIRYAQEARPYSIYFLLLTELLRQWIRALREPSPARPRTLLAVCILFLLSRGMAPVVEVAALALSCWMMVRLSPVSRADIYSAEKVKALSKTLLVAVGLVAPLLLAVAALSRNYLAPGGAGSAWNVAFWLRPASHLYARIYPEVFGSPYPVVLAAFALGAGFVIANRKREPLLLWLLLYSVFEPLLHAYAFQLGVNLSAPFPRYFIYTQILVFPIAAYGVHSAVARAMPEGRSVAGFLVCAFLAAAYALQLTDYYSGAWKTDYRSAGSLIEREYEEGRDLVLYSSFRPRGAWNPPLFGEGLYFSKAVVQHGLPDIADEVRKRSSDRGRIFLVLHEEVPDLGRRDARLLRHVFHGLTIIHHTDPLPLGSSLDELLDSMLLFYPRDSSRADLLLAKARWLCHSKPAQARALIDEARPWIGDLAADSACHYR